MSSFRVLVFVLLSPSLACTTYGQDTPAEVRRVDGYKGIWFTLGQYYGKGSAGKAYSERSRKPVFPYGDKYSGGLGTYTAKHTPLAIYSEAAKKTFFVYGGTTAKDERHLLCMISFYDHANHRVPKPVVVHDKQTVDDPHDNPSIAIGDDGHIWVFVSGRGKVRPGFKYRSIRPLSIDGFDLVSTQEMTYPQPHFAPGLGCLHLFTKYTGVRELYWESSKAGRIWTADQKLAGIREPGDSRGGHYQTSARLGNRIGTFFNRHPNGNVDRRTDLYYVETNDFGATWKTVDGNKITTPITKVDSPARAVDFASQERNVYLKDMNFDSQGRPVLLYVTSCGHEPGPPNDPRQFEILRWSGTDWLRSVVCSADHNYNMGSLYIEEDSWRVCIPDIQGPQPYHAGGEMTYWQSTDQGATWQLAQQITQGSDRNRNYARRPIGAAEPFHAFWADGDPTQLSESHLYFCDATGTRLWRLPYQMRGDWATPERVVQPDAR
ncbi:MAG: BNR-4 repeat-containing protein [Aureliella sp.]